MKSGFSITAEPSNPNLGLINVNTPLARALLGAEEASEISAHLPGGSRKLRVLHIHKLRRVAQTDEIDVPTESGLLGVKPSITKTTCRHAARDRAVSKSKSRKA